MYCDVAAGGLRQDFVNSQSLVPQLMIAFQTKRGPEHDKQGILQMR